MTPGFAVFILMNNYFHDVATAMPLACSIALAAVLRPLQKSRDASVIEYYSKLARGINMLAWFSFTWIVFSGIPRVLTFKTFEWPNAVEKHHEAGLMVKYVIAFAMMVIGASLWSRTSNRIREILNRR